jgi:hypothetical protein
MPSCLVLTSLAALQAVTLLTGAATAVSLSPGTRPAPRAVAAAPEPAPVPVVAHAVAAKAVVRRAAVHKPAPRPQHVRPPVVHRRTSVVARRVVRPALSTEQRMMQAVNRIPGYTGTAIWVVVPGLDHWGLADFTGGVVYISPRVPADRMYDVVAHEWSHVLSMQVYDEDVTTALNALNAHFGGTGTTGAERAADCMARLLGAQWTHYTPCNDSRWRADARKLLAHERLS